MSTPQLENGFIQIANELFHEIYTRKFSGNELRIILFVIAQTYGYKQKKRFMTLNYIANGTKIPYNSVKNIISKLIQKNVLIEKAIESDRRELGINKDYSQWKI